ncbi:MAG: PAS domain S-box protein [Candidatus Omnitrophica bacterium]|nr:PAS domain S-box protein [Candidatus Omnitrophota bacterium]
MFNTANFSFDIHGLFILLIAFVILFIGIVAFILLAREKRNGYFLCFCCCVFILLTGISISFFGQNENVVRLWYRYYTLLGLMLAAPSAYFAMLRSTRGLKAPWIVIFGLFFTAFLMYFLNTQNYFMGYAVNHFGSCYFPQFGARSLSFFVYFFGVMGCLFYHLFRQILTLEAGIERNRLIHLLGGYLITTLAAVDFLPGLGLEIYPPGYIPLGVGIGLLSYEAWRYEKALITPEIAADQIIDMIPDWLILLDVDAQIQRVNAAVCDGLGYEAGELEDQSLSSLIREKDKYFTLVQDIQRMTSIKNREMTFITRSGKEIPVILSAASVHDEDLDIQATICVLQDITALKKTREDLSRSYKELNATHHQLVLSEKMAGIGHLSAGIAHEINNPMGFVKSNMEVLCHYLDTFQDVFERYEAYVDRVQAETQEDLREFKSGLKKKSSALEFDKMKQLGRQNVQTSLKEVFLIERTVAQFRHFASPEKLDRVLVNMNDLLDKVLAILADELDSKCRVVKEYQLLPSVEINLNPVEQAFVIILLFIIQDVVEGCVIDLGTLYTDRVTVQVRYDGQRDSATVQQMMRHYRSDNGGREETHIGLYLATQILKGEGGTARVMRDEAKKTVFLIHFNAYQTG